jgi:hypothetical protein
MVAAIAQGWQHLNWSALGKLAAFNARVSS